jgi:ElaB/YqjD/DUF883 family membrane-anchored ribosome-binding protein
MFITASINAKQSKNGIFGSLARRKRKDTHVIQRTKSMHAISISKEDVIDRCNVGTTLGVSVGFAVGVLLSRFREVD